MEKPSRSFWQIWNLSFGFFGIQFGWGLQMANMSAIYEYLGARADQIPILWLAAPLTGLLVQPIVGLASDRTWGPLGRRRPYFLAGAILSSMALVLMPRCSALWMAAGLLWVLDASINISMQPFRAFVSDLLPESQCTRGFAMQSLLIGLSTVIASALPFLLTNVLHRTEIHIAGTIPFTVRLSFYMGAAVFLGAVLWTVFTTREYPPENMEEFRRQKVERAGIMAAAREILLSIREMPRTMRQLAWVQISTWLGLFCMWLYFPVAVIHSKFSLLLSMTGVGIAWANTLSMPFSILSGSLPEGKTGVYMGIFNSFVVIPEIPAALGFGWIMGHLLNNNRIAAVVAGGVFFLLAAVLMQRVEDSPRGNAVATAS